MKTPPIFEEIKLSWKGQERSIQPDRVLMCIAKIEDVITLSDLHRYSVNRSTPFAKLAMAYGAVLRHAGIRVTDDEVHLEMFTSDADQSAAIVAVQTLLMMMIPPAARKAKQTELLEDAEAPLSEGKTSATDS